MNCPRHFSVCDLQTATCQWCAEALLREVILTALPSTTCFADHAGVCRVCGVGGHSVDSPCDGSICADCTAASFLQCLLGACSVRYASIRFFLDETTHTTQTSPFPVSNPQVVVCSMGCSRWSLF